MGFCVFWERRQLLEQWHFSESCPNVENSDRHLPGAPSRQLCSRYSILPLLTLLPPVLLRLPSNVHLEERPSKYLRYPLAYEHVAELLAERGVEVDPSCIWRWVQVYAPELNKRCRPHLKPTNKSYRTDETYIKVKGEDKYLYRAVDSTGQTIEFLLTAKRDAAGAKRFFRRALSAPGNPVPRVINVDKNPAYPAAVEALKAEGYLPRRVQLRQCKYLNNVVEQDHRTVKKRVWLAKGYGSFVTAWRTLQGIEAVNMIRKGRARWVAKGDAIAQAGFIAALFGIAA